MLFFVNKILFIFVFPIYLSAGEASHTEMMKYTITWRNITVGRAEMHLIRRDGIVKSSFSVESTGFTRIFKNIDYRIDHQEKKGVVTVSKKIQDGRFSQNDTLLVEKGVAKWKDTKNEKWVEYQVPFGTLDYVSFMFDVRQEKKLVKNMEQTYSLALDGSLHSVDVIYEGTSLFNFIDKDYNVNVFSIKTKSSILFSRNFPEKIFVHRDYPVIMGMKIRTNKNVVLVALEKWTLNGKIVNFTSKNESPK